MGQYLDAAMLDGVVSLMASELLARFGKPRWFSRKEISYDLGENSD